MKPVLGVLAAASIVTAAMAGGHAASPARIDVKGMTVIVNHKHEHRPLKQVWNDVDQPTHFRCAGAAGCLVVIQAMVEMSYSTTTWRVCASVAGNVASPGCPQQGDGNHFYSTTGDVLQSAQVGPGAHVLQTRIGLPPKTPVHLSLRRWEVHYTIYEQ